ncbi:MAG: hypothetical protein PWQ55_411 [Chloroflexota bacterium]|nr:hypothetical protein [Chloroflexota bacterium]
MLNKKRITQTLSILMGTIILFSSACSAAPEAVAVEQPTQAAAADTETPTEPAATETPAPTQTPMFTATPDTRMKPEDWQQWPIIPEVTNKAREVYATGKELGVNPQSFSKIGDCQNIKESFMGLYDLNRYYLTPEQADWQETIDNFSGYFNRDGKAIEQGLNVAAALSPLQADPEQCQAGESPLACELRVANPSFAFVSFERWWPDVTPPDQYEKYLRMVLDTIMAHGTVPILVTKADNVEGNQQLNLIIAKLAYEYDLPLYNWWRAAQPLPYRGMDPERNDGFHISVEAWTERSAYALGTLNNLWKGLRDNG